MADSFSIKRHDRRPFFVVNLTDENGAVNLTTAGSALFNMRAIGGGTIINRGSASITSAAAGEVTYQWGTGDLNTTGTYQCEIPVIWSDGKQETYPGDSYWTVMVFDDIDNS